jgi:hypothetical protein
VTRETNRYQPTGSVLNTFGQKLPSQTSTAFVLTDLTNNIHTPSASTTSNLQTRHIPIKKDSLLSNGVGFNFRTIDNNPSSTTPYSHIITSIDNTNSIGTQGLRVNDYIVSINDENIEFLNHGQLEDKLRRAPNSETMRLLVADGQVYQAYKQTQAAHMPTEPSKQSSNRRQYRLERNPNFEGYGFRVRSNYQSDGTPHQIVSVEPNSPADAQGLRVGDYILRVNNKTVEHMNPKEFNELMQNLVRNDYVRDGTLLLEVMDEETYRNNYHVPTGSQAYISPSSPDIGMTERRTPTRALFGSHVQDTMTDEPYPKMRQCFIRVRLVRIVMLD